MGLIQKPYKIAVIDDVSTQIIIMTKFLSQVENVVLYPFSDPTVAFSEIQKQDIRGVITDVNMDKICGDELVKKCNDLERGIQCCVVTSLESIIVIDSCLRLGARSVLQKPVNKKDLIYAVQSMVRHFDAWNDLVSRVAQKKKAC